MPTTPAPADVELPTADYANLGPLTAAQAVRIRRQDGEDVTRLLEGPSGQLDPVNEAEALRDLERHLGPLTVSVLHPHGGTAYSVHGLTVFGATHTRDELTVAVSAWARYSLAPDA